VRLIERVRASVIGDDAVIDGPFGPRRIVYADVTASGRALGFVEEFICEQVLPSYANTHTEASALGRRTTRLRERAREIIRRSVGACPEDAVVFCGSGATGAIDKLTRLLALEDAVVFVGPRAPLRRSPLSATTSSASAGSRCRNRHRSRSSSPGRPRRGNAAGVRKTVISAISAPRSVSTLIACATKRPSSSP
jgi:hypothetical protein